jgi:histidine decarboxylase
MTTEDQNQLERYKLRISERIATSIGYPFAIDFNYEELYSMLGYHLNNVGDPYIESNYDGNTHEMEREVIDFFGDLFSAPRENRWGYVTNGGSEGNLYGLYVARELYPQGMVYYSESTHYSAQKNVHLLNMPSIVIRATEGGEMDYDDLRASVQLHRNRPAIILANIGTTMTEAKDSVSTIRQILKELAITSSYIHCDAALAGTYLALLDDNAPFNFKNGADSIACSGHKFIGTPIPCGIIIVRKNYKDRIGRPVPYIGSLDSTISGSRSGHAALFLWYAIKKMGKEGLLMRAKKSLDLAHYAEQKLNGLGIPATRNVNAMTVVIPQPSEQICQKWQLATDNGHSHFICMPGISKNTIDNFIEELSRDLKYGILPAKQQNVKA